MREFEHSVFCMDSFPEQRFTGFTDGDSWNGWACPYFDRQTAEAVLRASEANGYMWEYNAETDTFIVRNREDDEDYEPEQFQGVQIELNGEFSQAYPVGAYSWIWEVCEDS